MTSLTRGPLPARVYWTRRLLVLGLALVLVLVIARLLGGGSDGSTSSTAVDTAAPAAATPTAPATSTPSALGSSSATPGTPSTSAADGAKPKPPKTTQVPALAAPDGACADEDIAVTPTIKRAVAGGDVRILLSLRTLESPACTWAVSADTLAVKITSGSDDIWSSQQCPRALPAQSVTVRNNVTSRIAFLWDGKRSDADCSRLTEWALPGWYQIDVAALAGEPADLRFELGTPAPAVVTRTAKPTPQPTSKPDPSKNKSKNKASASPSGAVEPD